MRRTFAAVVWVLVLCAAVPAVVRADAPVVLTDEYGDWSRAVAALQRDTHAEGRIVHVHVTDGATPLGCAEYHLDFDAAGTGAFEVGACDTAGITPLRLVRRDALFDHGGDVVPHPRAVTIGVTQTRHASEVGRAAEGAGADLHCSLGVRPYVDDLEHGTRVYLSPGRFAMRVVTAGATAEPATDGWTVRGGEVSVSYEVVDTTRAMAVVVRDQVRLECEHTPVEPPAPSVANPLSVLPPAAPGATHVRIESARATESFAGMAVRVNGGVACALPCDLQLSGRNRLSLGVYTSRRHVVGTAWAEEGHADFDVTTGTPMRIALSATLMRTREFGWADAGGIVEFVMILCLAPGVAMLPLGLGTHDDGLTGTALALVGTSAVGVILLAAAIARASNASPVVSIGPRFARRGGVQFEGIGVAPVPGGATAGVALRF